MAKIEIEIPDDFLEIRGTPPEEFARELQLAAAIHWYSRTEVSLGRAAQIAGLNLKEFLEVLARKKIEYPMEIEDLLEELELAQAHGLITLPQKLKVSPEVSPV